MGSRKHADLVGQTFARWTVVSYAHRRSGQVFWNCRCECGTEREVGTIGLRYGRSQSCGCWKTDKGTIDIGARFGRLVVLSEEPAVGYGRSRRWKCKCDCGSETTTDTASLRDGRTTSCKCYLREVNAVACVTHGHVYSGVYKSWQGMVQRCTNPKNPNFGNYGGRGIEICERWRDFVAFLADMGERPANKSIDRIDNDRGYSCGKCDDCIARGEPANCRWATQREQARNTRVVKLEAHEPDQIRWLASEGISQRKLASFFGVSKSLVAAIAAGRAWSNST